MKIGYLTIETKLHLKSPLGLPLHLSFILGYRERKSSVLQTKSYQNTFERTLGLSLSPKFSPRDWIDLTNTPDFTESLRFDFLFQTVSSFKFVVCDEWILLAFRISRLIDYLALLDLTLDLFFFSKVSSLLFFSTNGLSEYSDE